MKHVSLLLIAVLSFVFASAQLETKAKFFNKEKRVAQYEVPFEPDIVEKAIADSMSRLGIKGSKVKGYQLYRNVPLDAGLLADLYVNVDRKSRKDKSSIISVYAVAPNSNPGEVESDDEKISGTKTLLSGLVPVIEETDHQNNIILQEKSLGDANKKLKRLEDDQQDLERKIKNFQEKLEKNKKEQVDMKVEIQKQQTTLEAMRARKS